jgi:Icc protein
MNRRTFLNTCLLAPAVLKAWAAESNPVLRFGIITDVHQDIIPDAEQRIRLFGEEMERASVDFVLQCGDFCQPKPENQPFLDAWRQIRRPRYHVLGNHDMDGRVRREEAVRFFEMPGRYYVFDAGAFRGIVLDGNDPGGKAKGYARFVAKAQLDWLAGELDRESKPSLLFIHQPLDDAEGIENAAEVAAVLRQALAKRPGCVAAVFSGHLHRDYQRLVAGVPSFQINSASYVWLGSGQNARPYPEEVHRSRPLLEKVAAYKDALWALVTLDRSSGQIRLEGRESVWMGPDPWSRGASEQRCVRSECRPGISDRTLQIASS